MQKVTKANDFGIYYWVRDRHSQPWFDGVAMKITKQVFKSSLIRRKKNKGKLYKTSPKLPRVLKLSLQSLKTLN